MKRSLLSLIILLGPCFMFSGIWKGKIYVEDGVRVVENYGEGIWGKSLAKKVSFLKTLSIGREEGEDWEVLSSKLKLAVGPEREIVVLDIKREKIIKFSESGKFLWEAGKAGEGPGEFKYTFSVAVAPDGHVFVVDYGKIHEFSPEGNLIREFRTAEYLGSIYFMGNGKILASVMVSGQPRLKANVYDRQFKLLGKFPFEYRFGPKLSGGGVIMTDKIVVSGGRVLFIIPDRYEFVVFTQDGKPLIKIRRKVNFVPTKIEKIEGGFRVEGGDEVGPGFFFRGKYYAVQFNKVVKEEDYSYRRYIDFYGEDGKFLGSYPLPAFTRLGTVDSRGNFYFISTDPFPTIYRAELRFK